MACNLRQKTIHIYANDCLKKIEEEKEKEEGENKAPNKYKCVYVY